MPDFMDFLQSQAEALDVLTQNMDTLRMEEEDKGFQSCIKFNGVPILPPVLDARRRAEMLQYRQLALGVESRLAGRRRDRLVSRVESVIQQIEERRTPTPVTSPGESTGHQPDVSNSTTGHHVHTYSSTHNTPSIPYNPLNYSFHSSQSDTLSSSDKETLTGGHTDMQRNDEGKKMISRRDFTKYSLGEHVDRQRDTEESKLGKREFTKHIPGFVWTPQLELGGFEKDSVDVPKQKYSNDSGNQPTDKRMDMDSTRNIVTVETVVERRKWSSEGEEIPSGQSASEESLQGGEGRMRSETESMEESETKERVEPVVERRKWSSEGEDYPVRQSQFSREVEHRLRSGTESTEESETRGRVDSSSGDDWLERGRSNTGTTEGSLEEVDYYGMSLQNLIRKSVEEQEATTAIENPNGNLQTSNSVSVIANSSANKGNTAFLNSDNAESNAGNIEATKITRQLKASSSFDGDTKTVRSSQCTTSTRSSSSSDSILNRTIIAKGESLQTKLTDVQGESLGDSEDNVQGVSHTAESTDSPGKLNEANIVDLNKQNYKVEEEGRGSTVDSGVGTVESTVESRFRSGTDDSVTSLLGEYAPLPTLSPSNTTPNVSEILSTQGTSVPPVQSDISDNVQQPTSVEPSQSTCSANSTREEKCPETAEEPSVRTKTVTTGETSPRTGSANLRQDEKRPESAEEPSVHTQTLTTSSMFFMSTDESLNTVAQSCTLPISPVSEDSDATLQDVTDFEEERASVTPVQEKQHTKPDATITTKVPSTNNMSVTSAGLDQSLQQTQELNAKKTTEVSTPKHVRRGSYTLEMPSPALLQAEEKQKVSPEGRSDYLVREAGQFPVQSRQEAARSGVYLPNSGFPVSYNTVVPSVSGAGNLPTAARTTTQQELADSRFSFRYDNVVPSKSGKSYLPATTTSTSATPSQGPHQHVQETHHSLRPDQTDDVSGVAEPGAEGSDVPTINPEFLEQELQKYEDLKTLMQHQHKMQLALLIQEQDRQRLAMQHELELQEERIKMQKNKLQEQFSRQAELCEQEKWSESAAALRQLEGREALSPSLTHRRDVLPPSPALNTNPPSNHRVAPASTTTEQYHVHFSETTTDSFPPNQANISRGHLGDGIVPSSSLPTDEDAGTRHTQFGTTTSYASPSTTHSPVGSVVQRTGVAVGAQEPFVWHGSPVPKPEVPPPLRMTIHDMTVPRHLQGKFERLSAAVKGYLTRRLLSTEKVQALRKTIKDTTELIMSLQQETPIRRGVVTTQDAELVQRVMVQLQAALLEVHDVFFQLPVPAQMSIISHDRDIQEERRMKMAKAETSAPEKRPSRLSSATQKALQRKQKIRAAEAAVFGRSLTAPPRSSSTSPSRRKNNIHPRILRPIQGQSSPVRSGALHRAAKHATKASEVRPKTAPNLGKDRDKQGKVVPGPKTARRSLYPTVSTMPAKGKVDSKPKSTKYRK